MSIDALIGSVDSPSGQAKIIVKAGYFHNGEWQDGSIILELPGSAIVEVHGFKRPSQAVINDAGFAVVTDWGTFDKPEGVLFFIRPDGTIFRQERFTVALGNLAIEQKGELVFLTTAASESEEAKLLCYNIRGGELLWSKKAPKPAAQIVVVPSGECILVGRPYKSCGSDYLLKVAFERLC